MLLGQLTEIRDGRWPHAAAGVARLPSAGNRSRGRPFQLGHRFRPWSMPRRTPPSLFRRLLPHVAMGMSLGIFCALTLIVMDAAHIRAMLSSLEVPGLAIFTFVFAASSLFAAGAGLTGFIFIAVEDNPGPVSRRDDKADQG